MLDSFPCDLAQFGRVGRSFVELEYAANQLLGVVQLELVELTSVDNVQCVVESFLQVTATRERIYDEKFAQTDQINVRLGHIEGPEDVVGQAADNVRRLFAQTVIQ